MKENELIDTRGVYYSTDGKGPFCPVCYLERNNMCSLLREKKSEILENIYYECTNSECQVKIFPKS